MGWENGLDWYGSKQGQVADSCKMRLLFIVEISPYLYKYTCISTQDKDKLITSVQFIENG
jgi:hypothetical protein